MKIITIKDCYELRRKFLKYSETAEQHEFPMLLYYHIHMNRTIKEYEEAEGITNQSEARAMFRVILRIIGEDFSEYEEDSNEGNTL